MNGPEVIIDTALQILHPTETNACEDDALRAADTQRAQDMQQLHDSQAHEAQLQNEVLQAHIHEAELQHGFDVNHQMDQFHIDSHDLTDHSTDFHY